MAVDGPRADEVVGADPIRRAAYARGGRPSRPRPFVIAHEAGAAEDAAQPADARRDVAVIDADRVPSNRRGRVLREAFARPRVETPNRLWYR